MKNWLSKKSNILFVVVVLVVLYQQFPVLKNSFEQNNRLVPTRTFLVSGSTKQIDFPPKKAKALAIFWATWCGPCKMEMDRLKSSVLAGDIPSESIFAINVFESDEVVQKFLKEHSYPFTFIASRSLGNELGITVTPTTIFLDDGKINSMSTGMSLIGIWKAELYL